MKKFFTLIAAVMLTAGAMAQEIQVNINEDGTENVDANTVLTDNECFKATTAFSTGGKKGEYKYAHANLTFPAWIEIRVDDEPSAENPNGTANKTSVVIVAKKSAKLSAYVRTGNNKKVNLFDQSTFTALDGTSAFTEDGSNNLWSWTWQIEAGKTYVLTEKGGTGRLSGFSYVEGGTGIANINADVNDANAPAYNLAGQRVNANAKGLVIKNGKKYVNK